MVDAAVGGKTGIDTPRARTWSGRSTTAGVLCDLDFLDTLPLRTTPAARRGGQGGFIADQEILRLVESDLAAARSPSGPHTRELVERPSPSRPAWSPPTCARAGLREILNYGHTLGHAIEKVESYRWRHGAAISVGMVYVAELAALAGRLDARVVERHRDILGALRLPDHLPR